MIKTLEHKLTNERSVPDTAVEVRSAPLIAKEQSLRDLRHALDLTQMKLAEVLGIGQEGVSRLEKRSDLLISTLSDYIEAMGGKLRLVAQFTNRPPVLLSGLSTAENTQTRSSRTGARMRYKERVINAKSTQPIEENK